MESQRTHRVQDPADGAVAAAADDAQVRHVLEQLQALHRPALGQVVHLARVQQVLEQTKDRRDVRRSVGDNTAS